MARVTRYIDDYSQKELTEDDGQTVHIQVGEDHWEMDMGADSLGKLLKVMLPWTDKAISVDAPRLEPRRGRGRSSGAVTRTKLPGKGPEFLQAVRTWARANGYELSDRGRIKAEIMDAFEAAH